MNHQPSNHNWQSPPFVTHAEPDRLAARLDAVLELHPIQANPGTDADGYTEDTAPYCPTCRVAAPCPTRQTAGGAR